MTRDFGFGYTLKYGSRDLTVLQGRKAGEQERRKERSKGGRKEEREGETGNTNCITQAGLVFILTPSTLALIKGLDSIWGF